MSFDLLFFFSSRRRHTRYIGDWSSDVCSSDLSAAPARPRRRRIDIAQIRIGCAAVGHLGYVTRGRIVKGTLAQEFGNGAALRSEERRVGKECRSRGSEENEKKNKDDKQNAKIE